jgi:hypothetical protein
LMGVAVFGLLSARTAAGTAKFQTSSNTSMTETIKRRITPPED